MKTTFKSAVSLLTILREICPFSQMSVDAGWACRQIMKNMPVQQALWDQQAPQALWDQLVPWALWDCSHKCPYMLAGHASSSWLSELGAGVPYNWVKNESLPCVMNLLSASACWNRIYCIMLACYFYIDCKLNMNLSTASEVELQSFPYHTRCVSLLL